MRSTAGPAIATLRRRATAPARTTPDVHPQLVHRLVRVQTALTRTANRLTLPTATAVAAVGLLVMCFGYYEGWVGLSVVPLIPSATVGLLLIIGPFAVLMTSARMQHTRTAVSAVVIYPLALYLSWFCSNPLLATRFDESLHVTTLSDILQRHALLTPNPMLPVSPDYPGLELCAAAVHWLTGVPLVAAQALTVALARVVLVLGLFWIGRRLGGSNRVGAILVLLYAASTQFWFFNAQFAYQTLALPLAVTAAALLIRAGDVTGRSRRTALAGAVVALGCVALTHHLTSWLSVGLLLVWGLVHLRAGERHRASTVLTGGVVGLLLVVAWSAVVGPLLYEYLAPTFAQARMQLLEMLHHSGGNRALFADNSGDPTPAWERYLMLGSVVLWTGSLALAGWQALRGTTLGRSPARVVPLVIALAYPGLLVARLSPTASTIAERASTFVMMLMSLVVAAWLVRLLVRREWLLPLVALAVVAVTLGGVLLGGGGDWNRVNGPYLAGAEQRSVDAQTIGIARWAQRYLPAGSRIGADVTLDRFIPDYAPVVPVTQVGGLANVTPIFMAHTVDPSVRAIIRRQHIGFLILDRRSIGHAARSGDLFEGSTGYGLTRLSGQQADKFDHAAGFVPVVRGPIEVYDVRDLWNGPDTFTDRPTTVLPGGWNGPAALAALAELVLFGLVLLLARWRGRGGLPGTPRVWLAAPIPALMAIGGIGVAAGFGSWTGPAVLGAGLLGGSVVLLRTQRRTTASRTPFGVVATSVTVVALTGACALSVVGAWQGLVGVAPRIGPPLSGTVAGRHAVRPAVCCGAPRHLPGRLLVARAGTPAVGPAAGPASTRAGRQSVRIAPHGRVAKASRPPARARRGSTGAPKQPRRRTQSHRGPRVHGHAHHPRRAHGRGRGRGHR